MKSVFSKNISYLPYAFSLIICSILSCSEMRGQNVSDLFVGMKDPMVLPMDSDDRLDLIDLYRAGKKAFVINNLRDTCVLENLKDDYLELLMPQARLELAILPMINDTRIVMLIKTFCGPVCDSEIYFYTLLWKKMDASAFIKPVDASWFLKNRDEADYSYLFAKQLLDMSLMEYRYDPVKKILIQTYSTPKYVSPDEQWKLKNYLVADPKIYKWDRTHFE